MEKFESRYHGDRWFGYAESPQVGLRQMVREELQRIRLESTDELVYEIAEKGLAKIELKDAVDRMQQFRDDVAIRQPLKRLGSIIIVEGTSRLSYENKELGLSIQRGDPYIDLHIPPLIPEDSQFVSIHDSMLMLAEYIQKNDIPGDYLIGVTYEKLARVSKRYGFTVVELDLPTEMTSGVERVYQRFQDTYHLPLEMGKILLCFQSKQSFLKRFGTAG